MVAQFLGLKLRILANTFRRSPWQVVGVILALGYALAATVFAVVTLTALRSTDAETARTLVVVAGSAIVLGFLVLPLAFGVDDPLDPRRFALFGIATSKLANLLVLTALVGVPSVLLTIVAIAQVGTWNRGALPAFFAVVGAVLIVATCVLAARVSTSIASFLLASRRAREASGILALVAAVAVTPAVAWLAGQDWTREGISTLGRAADVAGWTPLGAAWSAPADAAIGDGAAGLQKLLIALAFVGVLWLAWRGLVAAMLIAPHREKRPSLFGGLGFFGRLPATPVGAIAARSLTYWIRDARYRVQLVIVPVVPFLMVVVFLVSGVYWQNLALLPLPVMCLFLSWSAHNDVAYDNTAVWLHVASNTSGVADRLGRIIPVLLIGALLIAVGGPLSALLYGDPTALPSIIGVSSCILLSGLGLSSLLSAQFPYAAVRPGDSPFTQPQSTGGSASLMQSTVFLATVALSVPPLLLGLYGLADHGPLPMRSLLAGLGIGVFVLVIGVVVGGRIFERRGPELLAFTQRN
ncbi:MAG: ABC transporter permease [Burkholderiaceae bacterium]|nr:ABC transporter permease [Microbacteriaceae bacterium]